jgi:hypothetical protein
MGVLIGDVNASGRVDGADVSVARQQIHRLITSADFPGGCECQWPHRCDGIFPQFAKVRQKIISPDALKTLLQYTLDRSYKRDCASMVPVFSVAFVWTRSTDYIGPSFV